MIIHYDQLQSKLLFLELIPPGLLKWLSNRLSQLNCKLIIILDPDSTSVGLAGADAEGQLWLIINQAHIETVSQLRTLLCHELVHINAFARGVEVCYPELAALITPADVRRIRSYGYSDDHIAAEFEALILESNWRLVTKLTNNTAKLHELHSTQV